MAGDAIHSRRYRALRSVFRAQGEAEDAGCWICGMEIDYSIKHEDDWEQAWQLDHVYPRSKFPELALDPEGFRHSHGKCNNDRSDGSQPEGLGVPSRVWLSLGAV